MKLDPAVPEYDDLAMVEDVDALRAALAEIEHPENLVKRIDEKPGWPQDRLKAAFEVLKRDRKSDESRSHSIDDWLTRVIAPGRPPNNE